MAALSCLGFMGSSGVLMHHATQEFFEIAGVDPNSDDSRCCDVVSNPGRKGLDGMNASLQRRECSTLLFLLNPDRFCTAPFSFSVCEGL